VPNFSVKTHFRRIRYASRAELNAIRAYFAKAYFITVQIHIYNAKCLTRANDELIRDNHLTMRKDTTLGSDQQQQAQQKGRNTFHMVVNSNVGQPSKGAKARIASSNTTIEIVHVRVMSQRKSPAWNPCEAKFVKIKKLKLLPLLS
jgi:hypothetical protein